MGTQIGGWGMNNRRKLLIALGASALTAPLCSFAQQQNKTFRIGYLATADPATTPMLDEFRDGLPST